MPKNPQEFFCVMKRLIESGAFDTVGPREEIEAALLEVARAIIEAAAKGTEPTACERLVGSLFVRSIEQTVTIRSLVTIQDIDVVGSVIQ